MKMKYKLVRRVRITGPTDERKKALDFCEKNGYYVKNLHPKMIRGTLRYDTSKFALTAEKFV